MEKFCGEFDEAVFDCADNGTKKRMRIKIGKRTVVIDVYESRGSMKKSDELILKAVKQQTGIDLVKPTEGK